MSELGSKNCLGCVSDGYEMRDYYCHGGPKCERNSLGAVKQTKKVENMNDDHDDFGFTTYSNDEIKKDIMPENKAEGLYKMIMPLLENLKKDPEKEYLKWPNRVQKVDQFINKINKYMQNQS